MTTVPEFCKSSKTSSIHPFCSARILARAVTFFFVLAGIGSYAGAQSLGFVVNSTDGTVTVLANATTSLDAQAFSEDVLQTVTFPTQAGQSAVQLVATAVAPAAGSKTPPTRLVYVTDQKNNELWAFDISTISQGNAAAKPVAITAGSCSPLFNKPGAIAIAAPGSSIFAYVANSDGTVSIINLSTSSCVAKTAALGTITAMAASPDGDEVFILTATVGAPAALWEIPTSTQTAAQVNAAAVKLANPVSINVQNDAAECYFLTIGDKGNFNVFLAAVGPSADPNCPANATPTSAVIVDSQTPIALQGSNPVSVVSTLVPGPNAGSIYVADAAENEVWEIDCSASNNPPVTCFVNESSPVAFSGTPTTMGISLPQSVGVATAAILNQYLYVAGTSAGSSVLQYSNVGVNDGLFSFTTSSITVGNGPQGLIFSGPDPKDPPVAWFISASGGGPNFQGSTWVMPTSGLLTILGSTIVDLSSPTPNLNLNFGTTAVNGTFGSATIFCAPFGGGTGETTCPADSGVAGANAVGGQSSTTSGGGGQGGQPTSLDLPASTVFTVTLEACSEAAGCPASPNPSTDTVLSQEISAGGVCTLTVTPTPPTALNDIAIGQPLNAQINCVAPAPNIPPVGDNLTATITWKSGTTGTVNCTAQTCTLSQPVSGYVYENATIAFPSNTYTAAGTYPITISGTDTTEKIPILFTGTLPTIVVNGPTISVSPAGTASNPTQVQLLGTQPFAGTLNFSSTTPTVTWTLTSGGAACSPGCGTITNTQATQITGTLDYNISATYNAPSGLVSGTIILTVAGAGASTQAFLATTASSTNPPPACTLSSPPTSGQTGLAVTVTLSCTAPAGDSLSATVNWSDGEPQTMPGTADGTGAVTLTFTHTYANVGNYAVSVTSIQDITTGFSGTPPAAFSVTVYQTPTVTPVQTTVSLAAGQSVTFAVNFSGGVSDANITLTNFACQNLPTGASCAFSPASITLDANGNSNNTLELTVSLAAPPSLTRVAPLRDSQQILLASIWGLPLFGLVILGAVPGDKERKRRRQVWCALLFILVLVVVLMWMPACSSVSQSNVACPTCAPPGTYPITVTGSSVNPQLQASTVFQLTVSQ
jgi:hypothetical protein